jgi:hypothetical protein
MTVGAAMMAGSVFGAKRLTPTAVIKRSANAYFENMKCFEGVNLKNVRRDGESVVAEVSLPYGITDEDLTAHKKELEQATATHVRFKQLYGATFEIQFGIAPFSSSMNYTDQLPKEGLSIPLFTPFGLKMLDFWDETCCHLLVGGATRMGKSVFLRLLATHLIDVTNGNIEIIFIDNKITDLYPFKNLPQVKTAETGGEARVFLADVQNQVAERKALLKSKGDCVDLKELRERYPDEKVNPLFVIVDEYGRFADDDVIQEMVTEIAETAGYVDIHLVIASQRPDAKDVLAPRTKANMLSRICFATADETNSKIILDLPDAAHIGRIKGRAIILDGFPETVQVPYMSAEQSVAILNKYRKSGNQDDAEGSEDRETSETLPSFVKGSTGFADLS